MHSISLNKRLASEFIGSALLLATVVGSGIMGERLAGGNIALALLGNTIPTGAILVVLILIFGLLLTICGCVARAPVSVPYAVGLYITAAYWFTASTSFANPAVTIARSLSNTFAGIEPSNVAAFIVAQSLGAGVGYILSIWLWSDKIEPDNDPSS